MDATEYIVIAIVTAAGLMRGITGFGGAMLMAPLMSAFLGPVATVLIALFLEAAAGLIMVPAAWHKIDGKMLSYLIAPACITVPIGGHLLLSLDPMVTRKAIALIVVVFSIVLLCGFRYSGSPRPATSLVLGSVLGLLLGATSVGAPPVILYLLASPSPPAVTRANLTVLVTAVSVIGVVMLLAAGAVTAQFATHAAWLAIPFLAATWIGGHVFARLNDFGARRVALVLTLVSGLAALAV